MNSHLVSTNPPNPSTCFQLFPKSHQHLLAALAFIAMAPEKCDGLGLGSLRWAEPLSAFRKLVLCGTSNI